MAHYYYALILFKNLNEQELSDIDTINSKSTPTYFSEKGLLVKKMCQFLGIHSHFAILLTSFSFLILIIFLSIS